MKELSSRFDLLTYVNRIITRANDELILVDPFLNITENLLNRILEADERGINTVIITSINKDRIQIPIESIKNIQCYFLPQIHLKCICSDNAILFYSSIALKRGSEIALYCDRKDNEFTKIRNDLKELLTNSMIENDTDISNLNVGTVKTSHTTIDKEDLQKLIHVLLEGQNYLKQSIDKQDAKVMELISVVDKVQGIVEQNFEISKDIRNILLGFIETFNQTISALRSELIQRFDDIELISEMLSNKIIDEMKIFQSNINNQALKDAERNLETYLGYEVWGKFDPDTKALLITAEVVYCLIINKPQLDFSPAVIPITKALERVLNEKVFDIVISSMNSTDISDVDKFKSIRVRTGRNQGKIIDHATIGDIVFMFKDVDVINILYIHGIFKESINTNPYFMRDDSYTRGVLNTNPNTLRGKLNLIREKYRNKVAHKDGISLMEANECRDYMILSKAFLKEFMEKLS